MSGSAPIQPASELVIPGAETVTPPAQADTWGTVAWVTLGLTAIIAIVAAWRGRRRHIDPSELAFRRLAGGLGLGRAQIRAIRRAAAADPVRSPVAILLSPELTEAAIRQHARRSKRPTKHSPTRSKGLLATA